MADGFEVLEVKKGTWVEAIFAKKKAASTKLRFITDEEYDEEGNRRRSPLSDEDGEDGEEIQDQEEEEEDEEVTEPMEPTEDDTFYSTYAVEAAVKGDEEDEETEGLSVL